MNKTINPWICLKCAWHNSEEDVKCRNKTCSNTKEKNILNCDMCKEFKNGGHI